MARQLWIGIALAVASAACGGGGAAGTATSAPVAAVAPVATSDADARTALTPEEEPLPPFPSSPQPAPEELITTVQVANPEALLATLAGFAESVRPGAGAMFDPDVLVALAAQSARLGVDLSGIDLAQPIRLLMLDPLEFPNPTVAVVGVADEVALQRLATGLNARIRIRGGFAAIGSRDVLIAAGGYALTTLLGEPVPSNPTAVIEVAKLLGQHDAALDQMAAQVVELSNLLGTERLALQAVLTSWVAIARQIERVEIGAEIGPERASLITRIEPIAGSGLADFVAAQVPATFELLSQPPPGSVSAGGFLDVRAIVKASKPMFAAVAASVPDGSPLTLETLERWFELATGESALVFALPSTGATVSALWDVREPSKVAALWRHYVDHLGESSGSAAAMFETEERAATHRSVKVTTFTTTMSASTPPIAADRLRLYCGPDGFRLSTAVTGQRVIATVGTDATARAMALIDLAKRRKPKPAATALTPVIADARRRGESYLMAFDAITFTAQFLTMYMSAAGIPVAMPAPPANLEPAAIAIGGAGGQLGLRVTVPATQIAAMFVDSTP